eukprot:COSAG02_NODE_12225_length_1578_cov_0.668019_1_plen_247_part_10
MPDAEARRPNARAGTTHRRRRRRRQPWPPPRQPCDTGPRPARAADLAEASPGTATRRRCLRLPTSLSAPRRSPAPPLHLLRLRLLPRPRLGCADSLALPSAAPRRRRRVWVPHASTRVGASHASSSSAAAGRRRRQHGARPGPSSTPLAARAAHWATTPPPPPTTIGGRVAAVGVRVSPLLPPSSRPHGTGPAEGVRCCQRPLPSHHRRRRRRRRRCCLPAPCGRTHPATFAAWVPAPPPPLPRWWR